MTPLPLHLRAAYALRRSIARVRFGRVAPAALCAAIVCAVCQMQTPTPARLAALLGLGIGAAIAFGLASLDEQLDTLAIGLLLYEALAWWVLYPFARADVALILASTLYLLFWILVRVIVPAAMLERARRRAARRHKLASWYDDLMYGEKP